MFPFILLLLDVSNSGKGSLETCYQRTHTQAQMDGLFKHVSCFTAGQQQICQEWAQKSSTIFLFLFFFSSPIAYQKSIVHGSLSCKLHVNNGV